MCGDRRSTFTCGSHIFSGGSTFLSFCNVKVNITNNLNDSSSFERLAIAKLQRLCLQNSCRKTVLTEHLSTYCCFLQLYFLWFLIMPDILWCEQVIGCSI